MNSKNINDAIQECNNNPSCAMFYDLYGKGSEFYFCTYSSIEKSEKDSSILYNKSSRGNLNTLSDLQYFRDILPSFSVLVLFLFVKPYSVLMI